MKYLAGLTVLMAVTFNETERLLMAVAVFGAVMGTVALVIAVSTRAEVRNLSQATAEYARSADRVDAVMAGKTDA